jgi:hypothetical protein
MMFAVATVDGASGETSRMTFGNERARTDAEGVARIEDVPAGDYTLRVRHSDFAPASKTDVVVAERRVTDCGLIELVTAGHVNGKVLGADGKPVGMARVERRKAGEQAWGDTEIAMGGAFRLRGLEAGSYELRAAEIGPQPGQPGEPVVVDVIAGETKTVDLTVPAK